MDAISILRLLAGSARPFVWGKLRARIGGVKPVVMETGGRDPRVVLEQARNHEWFAGVSEEALASWTAQHPTTDTSMWAVSMDVGIRLHNLCHATLAFPATPSVHDDAIYHHAQWVWKHLERSGGMATSHLLGGLLGLVAAAAVTNEQVTNAQPGGVDSSTRSRHAEIQSYGLQAAAMLHAEIRKQILADGMSFEASTAYHRHVVDILVWSAFWLNRHPTLSGTLDEQWWRVLDAAVDALHVLEAAGMPLIGDNDDGMAVKTQQRFPGTPSTQLLWETYAQLRQRTPKPPAIPSHRAFADFGLDVWFAERYTLTARCGPIGQYGKGGHAHNDQNSITLFVKGQPVIGDPGTTVYTANPEQRNRDRSTWSHSTVASSHEQFDWPKGADGLFWMFNTRHAPTVVQRSSTQWHGRVVHGNKQSHVHDRRLRLESAAIHVADTFGVAEPPATMLLTLAPNVHAQQEGEQIILSGAFGTVHLHIRGKANIVPFKSYAPAYLQPIVTQQIQVPLQHGALEWTITLP